MPIFEIYLDGFLDWTSVTCDLIKWVDAPSIKSVDKLLELRGIPLLPKTSVSFLVNHVTDGVDVTLGSGGKVLEGEEELGKWKEQIAKAKEFLDLLYKAYEEEEKLKDEKFLSKKEKKRRKKQREKLQQQLGLDSEKSHALDIINLADLDEPPIIHKWKKNKLGLQLPTMQDVATHKGKGQKFERRSLRTTFHNRRKPS